MKHLGYLVVALATLVALPAQASIAAFKHIVVIVQENRTPDNLFNDMCQQQHGTAPCDPVDRTKYDIQTSGWKDHSTTHDPAAIDLQINWDIEHNHDPDWINMCDENSGACKMDGAADEICITLGCPNRTAEFSYVQRSNATFGDVLGPYFALAQTYGWANLMFATNQGPSFPAHQFIYGGTSAPIVIAPENDDASGVYAAENLHHSGGQGCLADPGAKIQVINQGVETDPLDPNNPYPCFQHQTLGTLLLAQNPPVKWRYYTPGVNNFWTAPTAILSECGDSNKIENGNLTTCPGVEFQTMRPSPYVQPDPRKVLTDIASCQLQSVSWVIPKGQYSDHAGTGTDYGPSWVASIVNSIGNSNCTDGGPTYWKDTAIVITWDDWGGWYDHEGPPLNATQGYQLGFRVPLLFVSAYGDKDSNGNCVGYIRGAGGNQNEVLDFGTIANFIENNFLGQEGVLGFADARAKLRSGAQDLSDFYDPTKNACPFVTVAAPYDANYFINDSSPALPPDDE